MPIPRWFYPLIATCSVVAALSVACYVALRWDVGRWAPITVDAPLIRVLDSRTGEVCQFPAATPSQRRCFPPR